MSVRIRGSQDLPEDPNEPSGTCGRIRTDPEVCGGRLPANTASLAPAEPCDMRNGYFMLVMRLGKRRHPPCRRASAS